MQWLEQCAWSGCRGNADARGDPFPAYRRGCGPATLPIACQPGARDYDQAPCTQPRHQAQLARHCGTHTLLHVHLMPPSSAEPRTHSAPSLERLDQPMDWSCYALEPRTACPHDHTRCVVSLDPYSISMPKGAHGKGDRLHRTSLRATRVGTVYQAVMQKR